METYKRVWIFLNIIIFNLQFNKARDIEIVLFFYFIFLKYNNCKEKMVKASKKGKGKAKASSGGKKATAEKEEARPTVEEVDSSMEVGDSEASSVIQGEEPRGEVLAPTEIEELSLTPSTSAAAASAPLRSSVKRKAASSDEDLDDDQPTSEVPTSETDVGDDVTKGKKARRHINLTPDQQERFIDWLLEHPQLYDKEHQAYKLTHKKDRLWKEAAQLIGAPAADLKVWFSSMRTRYGKLIKPKSGQAAKEYTDREKWIVEKFAFVGRHIQRVRHRTSKIGTTEPILLEETPMNRPESYQGSVGSITPRPETPLSLPDMSSSKAKRRIEHENVIQNIVTQRDNLQQMMTKLMPPPCETPTAPTNKRTAFVKYVESVLQQLDSRVWVRCKNEIIRVLQKYETESEELTEQATMSTEESSAFAVPMVIAQQQAPQQQAQQQPQQTLQVQQQTQQTLQVQQIQQQLQQALMQLNPQPQQQFVQGQYIQQQQQQQQQQQPIQQIIPHISPMKPRLIPQWKTIHHRSPFKATPTSTYQQLQTVQLLPQQIPPTIYSASTSSGIYSQPATPASIGTPSFDDINLSMYSAPGSVSSIIPQPFDDKDTDLNTPKPPTPKDNNN